MKILVADDDDFSRLLLARTLEKLGHDVIAARDGHEAWEKFESDDVHLVISDWVMPGLDGLELCRRIRRRESASYTYVILLTVMEGKGNYLEGMRAGADDFITKPFDEEQLATRLAVAKRILSLQNQNRQLALLIPICMYCKKARNDRDYWEQLDRFLMEQTEAQLSHGICPGCYEKYVRPRG